MKNILKRMRIPIILMILLVIGVAIVMASESTKIPVSKDSHDNDINVDNSAEHSKSKDKKSYSGIFGCIDRNGKDISSGTGDKDISDCTIDIPVTANVYVTASGSLDSDSVTRLRIRMDDWDPDWGYIAYSPHSYPSYTGFQISELYPKVKAGKHKISIRGESEKNGRIDNLVISIIVDQNGDIKTKSTG